MLCTFKIVHYWTANHSDWSHSHICDLTMGVGARTLLSWLSVKTHETASCGFFCSVFVQIKQMKYNVFLSE